MDAMAKKRADLKKLLDELSAFQEKVNGGDLPDQTTADAMDAKAAEVEALQAEISAHDKRMAKFANLQTEGGKIVNPILPDDEPPAPKEKQRDKIAGYMTLGDFAVASGELERAIRSPKGTQFPLFTKEDVPVGLLYTPRGRQPLVGLKGSTLAKMRETKAVPTIGTGVIEPDRVEQFVRVTEHDELVLRDVLDIQPTTSDTVYWTRITSYTRAADRVAHGAIKPEAALELDAVSKAVDTIAVQMPVQNQQLADLPALAGLINGELLYDLEKRVEELVIWGDGVGSHFLGLAVDPLIQEMREEAGDTLIDIFRRGITDVRRDGYRPNVGMIDPLDWETIVLEKGTDARYVWTVVTDGNTKRLWGVPIVETIACEDTLDTGARVMIIGDGRVGSTLWDRMQAQIMIGWVDDQFIRNMRTILAELRAAFGTKRPDAWRVHETAAGTS